MKNLKGSARFKSYADLNNIHFKKPLMGIRKFLFLCLGYVSTKRLETAAIADVHFKFVSKTIAN